MEVVGNSFPIGNSPGVNELTLEVGYLVKRGEGFCDITDAGSEELQHMTGAEHVVGEGDQFPWERKYSGISKGKIIEQCYSAMPPTLHFTALVHTQPHSL